MNLTKLFFVGLGSFFGGSLRYAISTWTSRSLGVFPLGTLLVNIIGGLLMGFIMQASKSFWPISPNARLFLTTGIMGGLTTFSTFSYESVQFFSEGRYGLMAVNVCSNLFLALIACWVGGMIARSICA